MSKVGTVLAALNGAPKTLPELAGELRSTPEAVEGMLRTLLGGGYVQQALPDTDGCACNGCSLKSLCRNAAGEEVNFNLLRLTPRGEAYLSRQLA